MKRLDQLKPKSDALIRPFWFPENCDENTGFKVTLKYISPSQFGELSDQITARFTKDGRKSGDVAPATLRKDVMNELMLTAIIKCEGVTYGKLSSLVPLDADSIRDDGGVDGVVAMDPTNRSMETDSRANILYLLNESEFFSRWVLNCCQNLALFQGSDWEARTKNSAGGPSTRSESPV